MKKILLLSVLMFVGFLLSSNSAQAQSGNNSNVNTPQTSVTTPAVPTNQTENGTGSTGTNSGSTGTTTMAVPQNQNASTGGLDLGIEVKEVESPKVTVATSKTSFARTTALTQREINAVINSMKTQIQGSKGPIFFGQTLL